MSWQPYIDDQLVATGFIDKGLLVGHNGAIWATTPGFNVTPAEIQAILGAFSNPAAVSGVGFKVEGEKYFTILANDTQLYGKKGATGIVCCKTGKTVIIGHYKEPVQTGSATAVVEKLKAYLIQAQY